MKTRNARWKLLGTLVVLAAAAVVLLAVRQRTAPAAAAGEKTIELTIVYDDGREETQTLTTTQDYLLGALQEAAEIGGEESAQYGYTLYTVNGVTADFTRSNAYWAIYIDGEYGLLSIDRQPLADNARYQLVYETY